MYNEVKRNRLNNILNVQADIYIFIHIYQLDNDL